MEGGNFEPNGESRRAELHMGRTRVGMLAVSPLLSMRIFRSKSLKSFRFEITFQLVVGDELTSESSSSVTSLLGLSAGSKMDTVNGRTALFLIRDAFHK